MCSQYRPEREDPMGWIEELQEALECPNLEEFDDPSKEPSQDAKRAAYEVAVALGRCRVFGLEIPKDLDGVLPPREAKAAAELATEYVRQWIEEARQLGARWDESPGPVAEALCCETLEACMESYFAMQAIMEALEAAWEENDPEADSLFQAAHQLAIQMDVWSEILQEPENLELLSTVAYLPLLDNWRSMLAEPYKSALPWWLDGTLEAVSKQIERICLQTLPAGETWRRMVRRQD